MTSATPSSSNTTPNNDSGSDAIASFITDWVQIKYYYEEAASLAHELCETLLASNGIRAIVTHRVKQGSRLEAKLRERVRNQGKHYKNSLQIRNEIVDLAGVRIALYFPSDAEKIKKIMYEAFADVYQKQFPEEEEEKDMSVVSSPSSKASSFAFKQRFEGYRADHYRVRMRIDNLSTKRQREDFQASNPVIEIQVASVLMHAWAEIDHDLVYKTLTSGPASREERRLLDATNGLVHTGEVLLQQLQTAMDTRVKYQKEPFRDKFELQHFLRTQVKAPQASTEHLDVLFFVLKMTKLNSPWKLGDKLEGLTIPSKSTDSIALAILEYVLGLLADKPIDDVKLSLKSRSVDVDDLKVGKKDSKFFAVDRSTKDKLLDQREILERAVHIADIMRFPQKSVLVIEGMPAKFRHFSELYHSLRFAAVEAENEGDLNGTWKIARRFKELNPLWDWFENNEDILFRVSFQLARLSIDNIVNRLMALRPSSGFQRHATMYQQDFERLGIRQGAEGNVERVQEEADQTSEGSEAEEEEDADTVKEFQYVVNNHKERSERTRAHSERKPEKSQAPIEPRDPRESREPKLHRPVPYGDRERRPYAAKPARSPKHKYKVPTPPNAVNEEPHTRRNPERLDVQIEKPNYPGPPRMQSESYLTNLNTSPPQTRQVPLPTSFNDKLPPKAGSMAAPPPRNSWDTRQSLPGHIPQNTFPTQPMDPRAYYSRPPEYMQRAPPSVDYRATTEYAKRAYYGPGD